jgi:hypothetical protein
MHQGPVTYGCDKHIESGDGMGSDAKTVEEYLASLPEDRRQAIQSVREVVLANLPNGFEEGMDFGMVCYYVPLETYPNTYNKHPLGYVALASQKNYMSLYLMNCYGEGEASFRAEWAKTGKKLDMGKACVRFKKVDDLALDLIGRQIGACTLEAYLARYEAARQR